MPILTGDIKLLASERLLDTPDGGGRMTGRVIVDGQSNNLFADISELDRTYGRVSLRKCYVSVLTDSTDSYFGAHTVLADAPNDPRVSVTMFTTRDWVDRRDAARDRVERYLARGPKWAGHLLETQLEGQRAIQMATRIQDEEPKVGQGLVLVQDETKPSEVEQYVRVTKLTAVTRIFTVQGKDIERKVLTVEISDPLRHNFEGPTVEQFEGGNVGKAFLRDTRVANAAVYYGALPLAHAAALNDASVLAQSIFTQLVPSAQSETPMVDLTAAGQSSLYVPGNSNSITTSVYSQIASSLKLYVGSSVVPGSLKLSAGSIVIEDVGSELKLGSTSVGGIEYDKGLLSFNANAPSYTGTIGISFKPAAMPTRVGDTASLSVVQDTRGYSYTITLAPSPQPGSLIVSYMAQGKVYELFDRGDGVLRGADSSFGTGSVNFASGSVILTTGALPDSSSEIIFTWGKATTAFTRSNLSVPPAKVEFTLANPQVAPGTVAITWKVAGNNNALVTKTATDDGTGRITGDANGVIHYASGKINLTPVNLYNQGTEFTVTYQFGPPNEQRFAMPTRTPTGEVAVVLPNTGGAIVERSVELIWNVDILDSAALGQLSTTQSFEPPPPMFRRDPLVQAFDVPSHSNIATIQRADGGVQPGSINYQTRTITFSPEFEVAVPKPLFGNKQIGEARQDMVASGGATQLVTRTWRYQLLGWQLVPTLATMPFDDKGYVIVRWRTVAGATSTTETFTAAQVRFDLTPGFAEDIVMASVRFQLGGRTYVDRLGSLYHSIDPRTGAGTLAGSIQYASGVVQIDDWTPGANNSLALESLVTEINVQPVDEVVFRVPIAPVRTGSVQIRAVPLEGNAGAAITATADAQGRISSPNMIGLVDYQSGVVRIRFGQKLTLTSANRASVENQPWYSADAEFQEAGQTKIIKPRPVYADTIRYNAVGYTYLPLSADVLGLDPVRLPSDGRVPIFRTGDVVVVHHTQRTAFPNPANTATLNVGRVRLTSLKVLDANNRVVPPERYSVDLDAGTVQMNTPLDLTAEGGSYQQPLQAEHRIEDMALITDVQINGRLTLNRPLTHSYPANEALVSSALIIGDLQARAHTLFAQATWTGEWADSRRGDNTIAQYNQTVFPIEVSNRGALQERWALIFTNTNEFRVIGESVGQIAVGNTASQLAPINPATNVPYFTLKPGGWGAAWSAGYVLRFNTAAANFPVWIARTVLQGPATESTDQFALQVRGDIDR
jgi:hypothetical protein